MKPSSLQCRMYTFSVTILVQPLCRAMKGRGRHHETQDAWHDEVEPVHAEALVVRRTKDDPSAHGWAAEVAAGTAAVGEGPAAGA